MRRAALVLSFLALAGSGLVTAAALAGPGLFAALTDTSSTSTTETTTATETTTTTETTAPPTEPPTTATVSTPPPPPPPRPRPKPRPKPQPKQTEVRLPQGVKVGGVHVGGLTPKAAVEVVRIAFRAPLVLRVGVRKLPVAPAKLGAVAYVKGAVARARRAPPGTAVSLRVVVRGGAVHAYVEALARRVGRAPVDSRLLLRNLRPFITKGAPGRKLDVRASVRVIVGALVRNRRQELRLPLRELAQKVSRSTFGPVVVIRRESKRLYYYEGMRLLRTFVVGVGMPAYPTPLGRFSIVVKWRNPWWYPPPSPWAQGLKPVPPGPGNPLGTRWMGLSAPAVGIHGTPDQASLGYSLSHGCIRMDIPQAEWLFDRLEVGTAVFIVPA